MASPQPSLAAPLHVQHLEKALRLDPFLSYLEGVFTDPYSTNISDEDSELSDNEKERLPKGEEGLLNGSTDGMIINGSMSRDELRIDKTRLYNFSKIKKDRRWLKEVLLSDSSDTSCDEDDEAPLTEEDLQEMLWLHKQQKIAQQMYYLDKDLSRYQHYSASLLSSQDKYYEHQKQAGFKKLKRKKLKDGKVKLSKDKKEKDKIKVKKKKRKSDDLDDDQRQLTLEERIIKKTLIRRKEADVKRRKLWALIVRKEIPRAHRQKSSARNNMLANCKKLAQLCQKEMRKEAQRSQKVTQQTVPKARRMSREMLVYWKKYEKVEKEHRKRAEKEAMEQRKLDDEFREVRRQQRKLNFLITQTELYAHFMSKKLKGSQPDEGTQQILRKLEEPSAKQNVKTVQGGVLIDMENADTYDAEEMKSQALSNAQRAFQDQESWTKEFDNNYQQESGKKVSMSQAFFDQSYSLANPLMNMEQAHPQPTIFDGELKSYQLKGMNWLINLYEQGINGILADEMGLGKTVQSIAFLSYLAETHNIWGPFLVVAPASTLHNWQQEVSRFVPQFKVLPYWGNQGDRKSLRKYWTQNQIHINDYESAPFHVLITSYQLVVQDVRYFQRIKWQYLVLDEAQAIKSSSSVRWKILLGFLCRNRLLLTGTPIQNSMAELWALLHFIMPTLFDSHEEFNEWFSRDIENHAENKSAIDQDQLSRLHMILKPFMLRRIKRDVENELSEKIEIKLVCHLTTRQRWLYQAVKNKISIDDLVYTSTSSSSTNATTSSLMNLVMQFRKVCNHPELFERRDVRSPIHVEIPSFHLPKLIYREGILESSTPCRTKILYNLLNIGSEQYIYQSLYADRSHGSAGPPSNCFSFLRFINLSPAQASAMMLKGLVHRLLALVILLKEISVLYHQRFWTQTKPRSRCLGRQDLILWPNSSISYPSIQSSSILPALVFTGHTMRVSSHLTHHVQPILDDDDHKPLRGKVKEASRGTRTRRISGSAVSPTSPTKRKDPRHRGHHHPHPTVTSPTAKLPPSPLKHSPTGAFSPTKHYGHSFSSTQLSPNRHHHGLPVSPSWAHQHPHGPLPGELQMGEHHPSSGHVPSMHPGQVSAMMHSPPGHGRASLYSPTGHAQPPLHFPPGQLAPPHSSAHPVQPFSPTRHGSSLLMSLPEGFHLNPAPRVSPIDRTLQPTPLPPFLCAYIPKVTAGTDIYRCSDRSSAYEIQSVLQGGSDLCRNLLLYGTPDLQDLQYAKQHLFPAPLGGMERATPPNGWSFVQIPDRNSLITDSGKLTVLDGLLRKLKMQGHRVLIYSQMTRMIDLLEEYMTYRKHKYMRLDGSSKISDRRDMVADFQSNADIFVFLLSTRAGGLGINLTAADTVIFYDSDWNPTVDQQAMDRAHRLGQTRQVTVYRLVTKGSIEERILQRAKEKSEIQKMVISGGHFKPEALKPKEVVSLLLDDAELECKFLQRQAEKKADEQRRRRERKRKKTGPAEVGEGVSPSIELLDGTPPAKAKKGRKSKSSLVPPAPEGSISSSKPTSETSSITGEGLSMRTGEAFDGDGTVGDDISVLSLDEVSLASGDLSVDIPPSITGTPLSLKPEVDDLDDPRSENASPALSDTSSKRGRGRGRGRGRARGIPSSRGRGASSIRGTRTRGRGRGTGGALAASAAASAAAAAASAAAYAAYGFSFQGTSTPNPTPPPTRSSPVAFGAGGPVMPGYGNISHPVARYDNSSGYSPVQSAENSPARSSSQASARVNSQQSSSPS